MNRKELDTFVAHHALAEADVDLVLKLAHAWPSSAETHEFVGRALRLAGALSLAAGLVFFVAANWQALHVLARFALVEGLVVVGVAAAIWQPPPRAWGRFGLLGAFVATGALLALFGQTYQTGADVYELFLTWALLGFVFAFVGQWSVLWAAWVLVLNLALALFCGFRPEGGLFWILFGPWGARSSELLLIPTILNLAFWALTEAGQRTGFARVAPGWLRRFVIASALLFATWAGSLAILGSDLGIDPSAARDLLTLLIVAVALAGVAAYAALRRVDVFPLTLVSGSLIVLGAFVIGKSSDFDELGIFFVLMLWLIASSTVAGRILTALVRAWRGAEATT